MPYRLFRTDSNLPLCDLTDDQQAALASLLEPEDEGAVWLDANTLEYLADSGIDGALVEALRPHVPPDDGIDIAWRAA